MTDFIDIPNSNDLQKLSGHIKNFRKSRETANFFFTARDQSNMRLGAILSALVGDSGQAATLSNYASSMEGMGDYVQFELDGRSLAGWLWGSPFKEGDYVEAAVKKQGSRYELFALYKPEERTIALYPHCIKGTRAFSRSVLRRTLLANIIFITPLFFLFLFGGNQSLEDGIELITSQEAIWGFLLNSAFISGICFAMFRKWLPFADLAEKIFRALDFPSPSDINLSESTNRLTAPDEDDEDEEDNGLYFKY
nr:putative type VI secretion system effector [Herbaspirillum sp. B39]